MLIFYLFIVKFVGGWTPYPSGTLVRASILGQLAAKCQMD